MILDALGTEYRDGRVRLPKDWLFRPAIPRWWEPQDCDQHYYKIVARGIGRRVLWQGVFRDLADALRFWQSLQEIGPAPQEWDLPVPSWFPELHNPGTVYEFATVQTFNSTPGGGTWTVPAGVTSVDYLVVAGGGGGGSNAGGGGGAGGYRTSTGFGVTPGATPTVTVGLGGSGDTSLGSHDATNGNNSVFSTITSIGGGKGGTFWSLTPSDNAGGSGGSGGGAGAGDNGAPGAASGTSGQGNAGGDAADGIATSGAGGGGATAAGTTATANGAGYAGGAGANNSISGISVHYSAGGGGGARTTGSASGAAGGTGAGRGGGSTIGSAVGENGTANTGGGGGGGTGNSGSKGGAGGSGIVILSYNLPKSLMAFRRPVRFFNRRF